MKRTGDADYVGDMEALREGEPHANAEADTLVEWEVAHGCRGGVQQGAGFVGEVGTGDSAQEAFCVSLRAVSARRGSPLLACW